MARLSCLNVTMAFVAVYASYLLYIYFLQHQPNAALLAAIKSKSTPQFITTLTSTLHTATPHSTLHSLHFGNGRTVAAAIAMHGTTAMLEHWHGLGGDVSAASSADGRTPLHVAATFNTPAFVARLLTLLPPPLTHHLHARASNSYTPLLYAVLFSQHNTTRLLLSHGASPQDSLRIGAAYSACQLAAVYSDEAMMNLLVEGGGVVGWGESYYEDWARAVERVQARREVEAEGVGEVLREGEERVGEGGGSVQDGVPVMVDGEVIWVGDEGQRSKAEYWAQKERIMKGEDPYSVFDS